VPGVQGARKRKVPSPARGGGKPVLGAKCVSRGGAKKIRFSNNRKFPHRLVKKVERGDIPYLGKLPPGKRFFRPRADGLGIVGE